MAPQGTATYKETAYPTSIPNAIALITEIVNKGTSKITARQFDFYGKERFEKNLPYLQQGIF